MSATIEPASPQRAGSGRSFDLGLRLLQLRTFIALFVVVIFFGIAAPHFASPANVILISKQVAINAILSLGMTFVIITGGIDLSIGSIVGLSGMIGGGMILNGIDTHVGYQIYPNVFETCLMVLAAGVAIGAINGWLITRLNVAPFIATLGTLYVARGAALLSSNGDTFSNLVGKPALGNEGFPFLGEGTILGLPVVIWMMVVLGAIAAYVAASTPVGRHIYAVGGNERAAGLSGIQVNRTKMIVYMFSGFCAAAVGLVITSQLVAAQPATGETFELTAIAAVVLGGTSMSGGRGTIGGTIIGAFVIGILSEGLVMMGVSTFWQIVVKGLVIILAVVVDQAQRKLQARAVLRQVARGAA